MPKLHLVMPMAGRGSRFFEDGFVQPKPLIEIHGAPFFYWAARSNEKNIPLDGITFVVLKEHIRDFGLVARIRAYWPDARIVALDEVTPGAAVTCRKGCEDLPDGVPLQTATDNILRAVEELHMPEGIRGEFAGNAADISATYGRGDLSGSVAGSDLTTILVGSGNASYVGAAAAAPNVDVGRGALDGVKILGHNAADIAA